MKKTTDEELNAWHYRYPSAGVSWNLTGDPVYCQQFIGEAKNMLYWLKNRMNIAVPKLKSLQDKYSPVPGATIIVKSVYGRDEIHINAPYVQELEVTPIPCMVTYDRIEHKLFFKYSKKTDSEDLPLRKYIDLNGVIERFVDNGTTMQGIQILSPVPWFCEAGTLLWMQGSLVLEATYRLYKYCLTKKVSPIETVSYGGEVYEKYNFIYDYDSIGQVCSPLTLSYNDMVSGVVGGVILDPGPEFEGIFRSYDLSMTTAPHIIESKQIPQAVFIREYYGGLNIVWDIVGLAETTYHMAWGGTVWVNDPNPPHDPIQWPATSQDWVSVQYHVIITKSQPMGSVINTYGYGPLVICVTSSGSPYMQLTLVDYPLSGYMSGGEWSFYRYYSEISEAHNVGSGFYNPNLNFLATFSVRQKDLLYDILILSYGLHYYDSYSGVRKKVNNDNDYMLSRLFLFSPFIHYGTGQRLSGTVLMSGKRSPPGLFIEPCAHFYYINGQFYQHGDTIPIQYMNPEVYPYGSQTHPGVVNTDIEVVPIKAYFKLKKMPNCDVTYTSALIDTADEFNLIGQMDGFDENLGNIRFQDYGFPYRIAFRLSAFCGSFTRVKCR